MCFRKNSYREKEWNGSTYVLINGKDIMRIKDANKRFFWEQHNRSKEEYKKFVEKSQSFFERFISDEVSDIEWINMENEKIDALYVYADASNEIILRKNKKKYQCINGRHRCAIAKKYRLNILGRLE